MEDTHGIYARINQASQQYSLPYCLGNANAYDKSTGRGV